jgi:hypothetical protein
MQQPRACLSRRTATVLLISVSVVTISITAVGAQGKSTVVWPTGAESETIPDHAAVAGNVDAAGQDSADTRAGSVSLSEIG